MVLFFISLLTKSAITQPVIIVEPMDYSTELASGLVEFGVIDVFNDGDSTLIVSADQGHPRRDFSLEILVWTTFTHEEWELRNMLRSLESLPIEYNLSYYSGVDEDEMQQRLRNAHVLLIPEQEETTFRRMAEIGDLFWDIMHEFVEERGGFVVAADVSGQSLGFLASAGLIEIEIEEFGLQLECESVGNHQLNAGVIEYRAELGSNYHITEDEEAFAVTIPSDNEKQGNNITAKRIEDGGVVYIGMDWWQYNDDMSRLLSNAVSWDRGSWLIIDPFDSEIEPNDSEELFISIDSRLTAGPGVYNRDIIISSNDPESPILRIPVELTVTEWKPALISMDPAEIFIISEPDIDTSIVILVQNEGSGLLETEIALSNPNVEWMTINHDEMTIDPGLEDRLVVEFTGGDAWQDMLTNFIQFTYFNPDPIMVEVPVIYYTGSNFGSISGSVIEAETEDAVEDVEINLHGIYTKTDDEGAFEFASVPPFIYQLRFNHPDFLEYTAHQVLVRWGVNTPMNVELLFAQLDTDLDEHLSLTLSENSTDSIRGIFENTGTGNLDFKSTFIQTTETTSLRPWQNRISLASGELSGVDNVYGAVFDGQYLYLSGKSNRDDTKQIFKLNKLGEVLDTIPQISAAPKGVADMAWDGELLWGSSWNKIYGFTTDGEIIDSIANRVFQYSRAITWDNDNELFWIADARSDVIALNRDGDVVHRIESPGLKIYGLAWLNQDTDNHNLYAFCQDGPSMSQLNRIDTETGDAQFLVNLSSETNERAGGCHITYDWDRFHWTLIAQYIGGGNRTSVYNLDDVTDWVILTPSSAMIEPDQTIPVSMIFNSIAMRMEDVLEGYFVIDGHQRGGADTISVRLRIDDLFVNPDGETLIPGNLSLTVHPNPFNNTVSLSYLIPAGEQYSLTLFDLQGRTVDILDVGRSTGSEYSQNFNGSHLSSGLYFLKLTGNETTILERIVLIR